MEFSNHARRRMRLRKIETSEALEALAAREQTGPSDENPNRIIVFGFTDGGRRLKIVLTADEQTVISVAVQGHRR